MSVCLTAFRRHRASVVRLFLVLFTLSLPRFSAAQSSNAAVNFTDSQVVPLATACTSVFPGRFHHTTWMDFFEYCRPSYPPDRNPNNTTLLNQGNGYFKSIEDSAIDQVAHPILAVDLNGDGYTDLILNNEDALGIGVQISNGDGTFKPPVYYNLTTPNQLATTVTAAVSGDFNGDGKPDVAVLLHDYQETTTQNNTDALVILLNTGSGGLKQAATYILANLGTDTGIPMFAAGKLNGDDEDDLAVVYVRPNGAAVPYFATGGGTFQAGASYSLNATPDSIGIGQFTASGYGDIAVATSTGIQILLGSSSGSFSAAPETRYPYPTTFNNGITLGDFDKDGKLDLAATDNSRVMIYWGAGNGTFSSSTALSEYGSYTPVAADINGDGLLDLASADVSGGIHIFSNLGDRNFRGAPATNSQNATGMVAADFNQDGKQDVAVVNTPSCAAPCTGTVSVISGTGASYFGSAKKYTIGMHGRAIAVGDLNGDGYLDLVVTNATPGDNADTSVLMGTAGGGFTAAKNYTLGSLSNVAYLVDMNGDGKLDLVEAGGVALGKGDGTFGPLIPLPDGIGFGTMPDDYRLFLGVGHFNADSIPDIAVAYANASFQWSIYELLGDGTGHFTATPLEDSNGLLQQVYALTVGKLNNGGPDDIVVANSGADSNGTAYGQAVIFFGDGKGGFTEGANPGPETDGYLLGAIAIQDFNHDGWPDIGVASADELAVIPGQDGTNFGPLALFATTLGSGNGSPNAPLVLGSLVTADFNGDGLPDVITSNPYGITRLYDVPVPTVSPGEIAWQASGTGTVTIKNTLGHSQAIQAFLAGIAMSSFAITGNSCGTSLASGATCTITLEYIGGKYNQGAATSALWIRANGAFIAEIPLYGFAG